MNQSQTRKSNSLPLLVSPLHLYPPVCSVCMNLLHITIHSWIISKLIELMATWNVIICRHLSRTNFENVGSSFSNEDLSLWFDLKQLYLWYRWIMTSIEALKLFHLIWFFSFSSYFLTVLSVPFEFCASNYMLAQKIRTGTDTCSASVRLASLTSPSLHLSKLLWVDTCI